MRKRCRWVDLSGTRTVVELLVAKPSASSLLAHKKKVDDDGNQNQNEIRLKDA
jgi:hypothetical protein